MSYNLQCELQNKSILRYNHSKDRKKQKTNNQRSTLLKATMKLCQYIFNIFCSEPVNRNFGDRCVRYKVLERRRKERKGKKRS